MHPDVVFRLPTVAVDGDEENVLATVLCGHFLQEVVVGVRIGTERRSEHHDDRPMTLLQVSQRKARALNCLCGKARNRVSDFESGDRTCQKQKGDGLPDGEDGLYSPEGLPVADFLTKLRMTRSGEKPQLKPKPRPG